MAKQPSEVDTDPLDAYEIEEVVTNVMGRGEHYMWNRSTHKFTRLEFGEMLIEPRETFGRTPADLLSPGSWRATLFEKKK